MKTKKILMVGIGTTLISAIAQADYIIDAANLINQKKIEISDLEEKFSVNEIKAVELKVKELQAKSDDKKNTINALTSKRARELKKAGTKISTEDQERDKTKKLEEQTQNKKKQEDKDLILVEDLEKNLNKRLSKLETRVSNLEKDKTKNNKNEGKVSVKATTKESKKVSKSEAIQNILRGKYGDGEIRRQTLRNLGFTDKEIISIQKEVNQLMEN